MSEKKRQKAKIKKTVEKLERGITERMKIRAHHEDRVQKLNVKIAAAEAEVEEAKAEL